MANKFLKVIFDFQAGTMPYFVEFEASKKNNLDENDLTFYADEDKKNKLQREFFIENLISETIKALKKSSEDALEVTVPANEYNYDETSGSIVKAAADVSEAVAAPTTTAAAETPKASATPATTAAAETPEASAAPTTPEVAAAPATTAAETPETPEASAAPVPDAQTPIAADDQTATPDASTPTSDLTKVVLTTIKHKVTTRVTAEGEGDEAKEVEKTETKDLEVIAFVKAAEGDNEAEFYFDEAGTNALPFNLTTENKLPAGVRFATGAYDDTDFQQGAFGSSSYDKVKEEATKDKEAVIETVDVPVHFELKEGFDIDADRNVTSAFYLSKEVLKDLIKKSNQQLQKSTMLALGYRGYKDGQSISDYAKEQAKKQTFDVAGDTEDQEKAVKEFAKVIEAEVRDDLRTKLGSEKGELPIFVKVAGKGNELKVVQTLGTADLFGNVKPVEVVVATATKDSDYDIEFKIQRLHEIDTVFDSKLNKTVKSTYLPLLLHPLTMCKKNSKGEYVPAAQAMYGQLSFSNDKVTFSPDLPAWYKNLGSVNRGEIPVTYEVRTETDGTERIEMYYNVRGKNGNNISEIHNGHLYIGGQHMGYAAAFEKVKTTNSEQLKGYRIKDVQINVDLDELTKDDSWETKSRVTGSCLTFDADKFKIDKDGRDVLDRSSNTLVYEIQHDSLYEETVISEGDEQKKVYKVFNPKGYTQFADNEYEAHREEWAKENSGVGVHYETTTVIHRPARSLWDRATTNKVLKWPAAIVANLFWGKYIANKATAKLGKEGSKGEVAAYRRAFISNLVDLRKQYDAAQENTADDATKVGGKRELIEAKLASQVERVVGPFSKLKRRERDALVKTWVNHLLEGDAKSNPYAYLANSSITAEPAKEGGDEDKKATKDYMAEYLQARLAMDPLFSANDISNKQKKAARAAMSRRFRTANNRRQQRARNAMKLFFFLGLSLAVTSVVLAVLVAAGAISASVFAPLGFIGIVAGWAASLWVAGTFVLPILIAALVIIATPLLFMAVGYGLGRLFHTVRERTFLRKVFEHKTYGYNNSAFVRRMTRAGVIAGVVSVALGVLGVVLEAVGIGLGSVIGSGLLMTVTGWLGGNVFALILATAIVGTGIILGMAIAGYGLGLLGKLVFDKVPAGKNYKHMNEAGSHFLSKFVAKNAKGAATGVAAALALTIATVGVLALVLPGVTTAFVGALAAVTFWGPALFIAAVAVTAIAIGAVAGAAVQDKFFNKDVSKPAPIEDKAAEKNAADAGQDAKPVEETAKAEGEKAKKGDDNKGAMYYLKCQCLTSSKQVEEEIPEKSEDADDANATAASAAPQPTA